MLEIEKLKAIIWLLEQEVDALRSVLSEWEQDKSCFGQMIRADDIRNVLNGVKR